MSNVADPFQILSLDGGGIKGLFSAAVLAKLEEKCQVNVVDHFDLITGTSTGGIIALGLGVGMRPREIVQFYVNAGPEIFKNTLGWRWGLQWFYRKFPQSPLMDALRNQAVFGDKRLADSKKRLVIPSYNLGTEQVRVFKTPHHVRLTTDWEIPMWKVALATSAAPTFFPACCEIASTRLIDGGVWANNPAMLGIVEAVSLLNCRLEDIKVLSLGTTDSRKHRRRALDHGGILQWLRKKDVVEILMQGQSVGVNGQASLLLGKERFHRLDPVVPEGIYHLDKVSLDDILGEAEQTALHFAPQFSREFKLHAAVPFDPLLR